jgi:uncharacterized protein YcbX
MVVGSLGSIWRHPVKSMEGERIERTPVGENGIPGDRAWAVRDEERGGIRGAKKIPGLMTCRARYPEEPSAGRVPPPELTLPDGQTVRVDAPDAAERVSRAVGRKVTLWPLRPASDREHYRRGPPDHADVESELRAVFGRTREEPLPDLARFPRDLVQFESPPGTYFDAYPLLLLTEATLRRLRALAPASRIDVRRFRPNLVIDTADEGFVEAGWVGRELSIGSARLRVIDPCPRCVMITHGFGDLPRDPGLMRTVVRDADQNVGVYATVVRPGELARGDAVELV